MGKEPGDKIGTETQERTAGALEMAVGACCRPGCPDSCGRGSEPIPGVPCEPVQRKGELADRAVTEFQGQWDFSDHPHPSTLWDKYGTTVAVFKSCLWACEGTTSKLVEEHGSVPALWFPWQGSTRPGSLRPPVSAPLLSTGPLQARVARVQALFTPQMNAERLLGCRSQSCRWGS